MTLPTTSVLSSMAEEKAPNPQPEIAEEIAAPPPATTPADTVPAEPSPAQPTSPVGPESQPQTRPHISAMTIVQAVLILLTLIGLLRYTGVIPKAGQQQSPISRGVMPPLPPVRAGEIVPQFKIVSVTREYAQPIKTHISVPMPELDKEGWVGKAADKLFHGVVPGTSEYLIYDMVTTVTAGIDLSQLHEGDIQNDASNTTITLPQPNILSIAIDQQRSQILWHDKPMLVGSESAKLLIETQKKGEEEIRNDASGDHQLMRLARENAEMSLRQFLQAMHPDRTIAFQYKSTRSTTAPVLIKMNPPEPGSVR